MKLRDAKQTKQNPPRDSTQSETNGRTAGFNPSTIAGALDVVPKTFDGRDNHVVIGGDGMFSHFAVTDRKHYRYPLASELRIKNIFHCIVRRAIRLTS